MPTVNLSPIARRQYLDSNGDPVVGGLLFYYAAGSSTKQSTYTDSSGTVANSNPIVLDASGRTPQGVWFEAGLLYKEVLALATDTDPPTSPIYSADGLEGVNDTTTPAALASSSQWVATGLTPTYVSATQFTLVGDQTAAFHVGRRLRLTVTAGTVYGRISVSAFGALTTVTVVLDSGALDAGLSAVDVGILTALNNSMPEPSSVGFQPLDATLTALAGGLTAANKIPYATALNTLGELDFKDEDDMASDSATALPSQQSVKAYVGTAAAAAAVISAKTAQSAAGSAVNFTSIPATAKRITVLFSGVSLSGINDVLVQIGDSGGLETSGYVSTGMALDGTGGSAVVSSTSGFLLNITNLSWLATGRLTIELIDGTTWISSHTASTSTGTSAFGGGSKTLTGVLDRVTILPSGADTFDSGTINILYE